MAKSKKAAVPKANTLRTEEKILASAKKLFTAKGFHAVTSRDIANEAGINLALLNYYFRSKELIYEKIMVENLQQFKAGIAHLFGDRKMDLFEKFEHIAELYYHEFSHNPDLPLFISNAIATNPEHFIDGEGMQESRLILFEQIQTLIKKKKIKNIHFVHIILNFMSMMIFPYLMASPIKKRANLSDKQYDALLKERIQLIPIWMKELLKP